MTRRTAGLVGVVLVGALMAGCAGGGPEAEGPGGLETVAAQPPRPTGDGTAQPPRPTGDGTGHTGSPPGLRYSAWERGVHVLPLRPDGFGEVLPTPRSLRVRRYPTIDRLPPPDGGRFRATVQRIGPVIRKRMGTTWEPGCPVPLRSLRYLTVSFRGFDRLAHTGELVVHEDEARDVVSVFRQLFTAGFPIEAMRLPKSADLTTRPTGDGNGTAGMVCRVSRSSTTWSAHAYGLAIDINPFMNPYQRDDLVLPERASAYLNRHWRRPGMVTPDGVVVRAFARIGWTWGGRFDSVKDYMHFSATGR